MARRRSRAIEQVFPRKTQRLSSTTKGVIWCCFSIFMVGLGDGCSSHETTVYETVEFDGVSIHDWSSAYPEVGDYCQSYLVPDELHFGCVFHSDDNEDRYAALLDHGSPAEQLLAARALWVGRSRRQAANVLKFVAGPAEVGTAFVALKHEIESSMQISAILRELQEGDYLWGTWLACLRPHKDFVPVLLAALQGKPQWRAETLLALGNSRDPRALEPLLAQLERRDDIHAGFAAAALGYLGDPSAEPKLIEVLAGAPDWRRHNACQALAKIGTRRALPALELLAKDVRHKRYFRLEISAKVAINNIKQREPR